MNKGRRCSYLLSRILKPHFTNEGVGCPRCLCTHKVTNPRVAIIGSGPAGFYTAQQIIKGHAEAEVDVFEKLPVPFGLVRFGVAPDHPEVKNVINTFTTTAKNPRCRFLGNVNVGKDVTIGELQKIYSAVVLSYGADEDKQLQLEGEDLNGVMSARNFVGWYNGLPDDSQLTPNLDTESVVVLGHGNVAIDVARILLTPVDILKKTDITEASLDALSKSRVRKVYLVGRRGPLQVAFTIAELREMIRLPETRPLFNEKDFQGLDPVIESLPRPRRRLTELLIKSALTPDEKDRVRWSEAEKEWRLCFLRSPSHFLSDESCTRVAGVRFHVNRLQGEVGSDQSAVPTDETEDIACGLVLRSIGYRSVSIDSSVTFDSQQGVIPNKHGRVLGQSGLYCSGWVKRGPVGVIVSTMNDAFETGMAVVKDIKEGKIPAHVDSSSGAIDKLLADKGIKVVEFEDWERIDKFEVKQGELMGKPREKITSVEQMLDVVKS